jgi:hypothetical protein
MTATAMGSVGCAHVQRPESRIYVVSASAAGVGALLASGGAGGHDCQKEHEECVGRCWNKKNWPYPHNRKQSGWYLERCEHDCREEFNRCEEEQEEAARQREKPLEFSGMDDAIEWIREHKAEVAIGTVVIVAGVAFVLATGGSGALILDAKMKYDPNFDVDSVLDTLRSVNEKYQEGSPEDEALRIAAVALFYIREKQRLDDYREFFRSFYTPAIDYIVVSQSFSTREEADAWLASGRAREGERVRIAGEGFRVIPERKGTGLRFLRSPLPEELMKKYPPESE